MAVWLIRAGSHGEFQDKFLSEKRAYVTSDRLDVNLKKEKKKRGRFYFFSLLSP